MSVNFMTNATKGTDGAHYVPTTITELSGMIGKIAEQVIREVTAENHLSMFEKRPITNGDTVEQAVTTLATSQAYDKDGTYTLARQDPTLAVRYFNSWTRATFKTTVDTSLIRKVLETGKGVEEISSKIVAELNEGDTQEKYEAIKSLLKWGRQDQTGKALVKLDNIAYNNGIDYQALLVQLKDTVKGMQFVNTTYNGASLKRRTRKDDIVIVMPYKLKNRVDVEELAGVFNLDKAEIKDHIVEVDVDVEEISGQDCYPVYVVDKNAILVYTRLYEMVDQKNAEGYFWNYFLQVERMFAISQLFDGCYFFVEAEASA